MREYALYLFDFDNTLFDTRCGIEAILREALPVLGVEYGPDSFDECLGLTMDQVYDRSWGTTAPGTGTSRGRSCRWSCRTPTWARRRSRRRLAC